MVLVRDKAQQHTNKQSDDQNLARAIAQVEAIRSGEKPSPVVRTFFHVPTFTATHVVHDPGTRAAAIIDSVQDFDRASGRTSFGFADTIVDYVRAEALVVEWLLETHAHADHLSAAPYLRERLGGRLAIGNHARADFPGGDAKRLYQSIRRLMRLPDDTRVFLCHDYKAPNRDHFTWETTIGAERKQNVHVHDGVTEQEFVEMRQQRDATLDLPRLILPSIQVNMHGGRLPEPESNGVSYLKLPLNQF